MTAATMKKKMKKRLKKKKKRKKKRKDKVCKFEMTGNAGQSKRTNKLKNKNDKLKLFRNLWQRVDLMARSRRPDNSEGCTEERP